MSSTKRGKTYKHPVIDNMSRERNRNIKEEFHLDNVTITRGSETLFHIGQYMLQSFK